MSAGDRDLVHNTAASRLLGVRGQKQPMPSGVATLRTAIHLLQVRPPPKKGTGRAPKVKRYTYAVE